MSSYFQNFALLMQRLGSGNYGGIQGFGQTAIVHVEPDLSGYTQQAAVDNQRCYGYCSGQGNNPALLRASVASSGYSPVSAYPNTYQGFNWALLHLRDLYAPNVKLAFHVSNWATSADVSSDSSTSLNATALGQQVGSFAAQSGFSGVPAGTSSYDLVFNDVSDRDASYYKYVYNDPSRWWDRLNVKFPNFHRWESYISAAGQATGRPIMVWQVPEGNQYFATVNNTNGHYQDNRAEYIFSHIAELAQAGVIGVLFGAGNGGSTVQHDGMGDGITNPASFCTSDGLSSGQICNTHTSTVSDDDGGYLRMQGQQYYASGGYSLTGGGTPPTATPGTTATSTPVPPTATKTVVVPTATKSVVVPTATKTAVVPTATKTAVAPTATATQPTGSSGTPSFTQSTTTSPASITGGTSSTLRTTVKVTSGNLVNGLVDLEVYNASWQKIGQRFFTAQNLSAGQSASYSYVWTSPNGAGTYTVMVGVFGPNWSPNYLWNSSAGTISAH
ncbi:MAG: hypothetical protein JWO42_2248 [Chloroflexi bacterium]|nr:hypothetical protein [Chloroflexota bacterium]